MSDQQFNHPEERQREAPEAFSTDEKPQNRAWERVSRLVKRLKPGQILTIGFFSVVMLGALLLTLPVATIDRETLGFVDALFTATSAVCVTGLTVVNTGVTFSLFGQVVIILLIQVGGLGFMTMASLVFLDVYKRQRRRCMPPLRRMVPSWPSCLPGMRSPYGRSGAQDGGGSNGTGWRMAGWTIPAVI